MRISEAPSAQLYHLSPAGPQEFVAVLAAGDTFSPRPDAGTLAHFHIGNTTAGQMLVNEGLAKVWEGRRADWC